MLSWFRKPIAAEAPLVDYWIQVHVWLNAPIVDQKGRVLVGYIRMLGLRATPDSMRSMVSGCVDDGDVTWDKTEVRIVDVRKLSRSVAKPLRRPFGAGVWHQSGRIYFPADTGTPGEEPELHRFAPKA